MCHVTHHWRRKQNYANFWWNEHFKILSGFIGVSKGKNVSFSKFTTGNLWESKRTRSINNSYLARACQSSLFLLEDCVDWTPKEKFHAFMSGLKCNAILCWTDFPLWDRLALQQFCNFNCQKNFTCPLGKWWLESTSPIAKSSGLSDYLGHEFAWRNCTWHASMNFE